MAKKKELRRLTEKLLELAGPKVSSVLWPRSEDQFNRMSSGLEKAVGSAVMDATWDASNLIDWTWDTFDQVFTFSVSSIMRLDQGHTGRPVIMKSRFSFDPSKPWPIELGNVFMEVHEYSNTLLRMQRAYFATLKEGSGTRD